MASSSSQIQQVKEAADIVEVIGQKVDLKRSGTNWRGLCPFHSENSPSFFVNDQIQRYKCFGCGESGDVFTFLQKYDGMSFGESLRMLADQAGITLKEYKFDQADDERQQLLSILNLAKEYYHYLLSEHSAGAEARAYLKDRGVHKQSLELFELGFSLDSWDGLIKYLVTKKKFKVELLERAGLAIKGKGGRYYDRFRGRVMFPLKNHRGQVVGFSGRTLDPDAKTAKYINSPETELYHKSELLYGLSELYQEIRKAGSILITEGEFDVVSSAQAHVNNIVAVKGSTLTKQHVERLKRTVSTVVLALDADEAGIEATKRAIPIVQEAGLELRVIAVKGGKDVDELARTEPAQWRELSKQSVSVFEYLLEVALRNHNPKTADGKRKIMAEVGPVLAKVKLAVERDVYVSKLAKALGSKETAIQTDLNQFARVGVQKRSGSSNSMSEAQLEKPKDTLDHYLLFLLSQLPPNQWSSKLGALKEVHWQVPGVSNILEQATQQTSDSLQKLASQLDDDLQQLLMDASSWPAFETALESSDFESEWKNTVSKLKQRSFGERIAQVTKELEALEASGVDDPESEALQAKLLKEIVSLQSKLKISS